MSSSFGIQSKTHTLACNYSPQRKLLTFANIQPENSQFFYFKEYSIANYNIKDTEMAVIFNQMQDLYNYLKTEQQRLTLTNRSLKVPVQINKKNQIIEIRFDQTKFTYLQGFYRTTIRNLQKHMKQKTIDLENYQKKNKQIIKGKQDQIKKVYREMTQKQNSNHTLKKELNQKSQQITLLKKQIKKFGQLYDEQKQKKTQSLKEIKKLKLQVQKAYQQSNQKQKHHNFLHQQDAKKLSQLKDIIKNSKQQLQNLKKVKSYLQVNSEKLQNQLSSQLVQIQALKSKLWFNQQEQKKLAYELNFFKIHNQEQKQQFQQKIIKIQFQKAQQQKLIEKAQLKILNLQNQITILIKQLAQKNQKIQKLQRNFDQEIQKLRNQTQLTQQKQTQTQGMNNNQITNLIQQDCSKVEVIHLSNNEIKNEGLQTLMKVSWPNLKQLHIFNNKISSIQSIDKLNLRQITNLSLQKNLLTIKSAQFLVKQNWSKLKCLGISFIENDNEESWKVLTRNKFKQFNSMTHLWVVGCQNLQQTTKGLICDWWRADKISRNIFWEDKNGNAIGQNDKYKK